MRRTLLLLFLPGLAACQAAAASPAEVAPAFPYDLPQAAEWSNVGTVFTVAVGANGAMRVDGKIIESDEALRTLAARAREQTPHVRALIHADVSSPWKNVLHVMDLLKQARIYRFAFGVAPQGPASKSDGPSPPPPMLRGTNAWDCAFPPAADAAGSDEATVVLTVEVAADGAPQWVQILSDPGHGFGMVAAQCAMKKTYAPALDENGKPIAAQTPPIRVKFVR